MTYEVPLPVTKYVCYTCEWALHGNLCKHQVVVLHTCTNLTKKISFNIVGHCMDLIVEVLLPCLQTLPICIYDNEYDDEEVDEDHYEEPWVIDMCGFMTSDDTSPNVEKKKDHNQPSSSSTPT